MKRTQISFFGCQNNRKITLRLEVANFLFPYKLCTNFYTELQKYTNKHKNTNIIAILPTRTTAPNCSPQHTFDSLRYIYYPIVWFSSHSGKNRTNIFYLRCIRLTVIIFSIFSNNFRIIVQQNQISKISLPAV